MKHILKMFEKIKKLINSIVKKKIKVEILSFIAIFTIYWLINHKHFSLSANILFENYINTSQLINFVNKVENNQTNYYLTPISLFKIPLLFFCLIYVNFSIFIYNIIRKYTTLNYWYWNLTQYDNCLNKIIEITGVILSGHYFYFFFISTIFVFTYIKIVRASKYKKTLFRLFINLLKKIYFKFLFFKIKLLNILIRKLITELNFNIYIYFKKFSYIFIYLYILNKNFNIPNKINNLYSFIYKKITNYNIINSIAFVTKKIIKKFIFNTIKFILIYFKKINFDILICFYFVTAKNTIKLTTNVLSISLKFLLLFGLPIRIFLRIVLIKLSIIKALFILLCNDVKVFILSSYSFIKYSFFELFFRLQSLSFIFINLLLYDKLLVYDYLNINLEFDYTTIKTDIIGLGSIINSIFFFNQTPIINSIIILILIIEYGSLYFSTMVAKKIMYSTYFLFVYIFLLMYWFLPEFEIFKIFLFKYNGIALIFMFIFRSLREDHRFLLNFRIDPHQYKNQNSIFRIKKHISVMYRFNDRLHSPQSDFIFFLIFVVVFKYVVFDFREVYVQNSYKILELPTYSIIQNFCIILYFVARQSSYSFFFWFLLFSHALTVCVISTIIVTVSDFSFFGLLSDNLLNETNAIGNIGLISSPFGFEDLLLFKDSGQYSWYYGEFFNVKLNNLDEISRLDQLQFTNSPFNIFGDIHVAPHLITPHDDHNWTISEELERSYFNNLKGIRSLSDSSFADTLKYWPVDRSSYIWFGEFLETDIYYGWSHQVLIDLETYFDYSPYALTNIFGDGLIRSFVTDILTMFVGPVELDQSNLLNLNDWGSNYTPGVKTNRISGGEMSGLENSSTLDMDQKIRENGENFHEWFPGLFILDGRLDSRHSLFFLRIFLLILIPFLTLSLWFSILGKKSSNIDETFSETDMANFNFFFFGNEQIETFNTYYWSNIYNTNYEWPTDKLPLDPIPYDPTSNLFEELFRHISSGLFDYTILDSFFHIPILKHTEGYSSATFKDRVMPIMFPTGLNTESSNMEDFSMFFENIKKITEKNKNNTDFISNYWNLTNDSNNFLSEHSLSLTNNDLSGLKINKIFNHNNQYRWKIGESNFYKNQFEIKEKPYFWKNFLLKFREYDNTTPLKVKSFRKRYLKKNGYNKNLDNFILSKDFQNKNSFKNSNFLKLFFKNVISRKSFSDEYNFENISNILFDKKLILTERLNTYGKINSNSKIFNKNENYDVLNNNDLKSRKILKFKNELFNNDLKNNKEKLFSDFYTITKRTNDYGYNINNLTDKLSSNIDSLGNLNLDLYIKSNYKNDILANSVAYETNLEYSNLFESLILEIISPSDHRHRDLEYEFENSNPAFSTIEEFADPEGNYGESGIFENDSVIDDPRTETIFEMPGNDNYRESFWEGATYVEYANAGQIEEKENTRKKFRKRLVRRNRIWNVEVGQREEDVFWNNLKIKKLDYKNKIKKQTENIKYNRDGNGIFKKNNFFSKNKLIWNPESTTIKFKNRFSKYFKGRRMVRKRFDVFNYHKNYIKNNIKYNNFYNVWEPITKILTKFGLKEILKKKIKNKINKIKINLKNLKNLKFTNPKYNFKVEKNILNRLIKISLNVINRNFEKEVRKSEISIGSFLKNNLIINKNNFKIKHSFYLNNASLIPNYIQIKKIEENKFLSLKKFKTLTYNLNIKTYYLNFLKFQLKNNIIFNFKLVNKKILKKKIWKLFIKYKTYKIINKKINFMVLKKFNFYKIKSNYKFNFFNYFNFIKIKLNYFKNLYFNSYKIIKNLNLKNTKYIKYYNKKKIIKRIKLNKFVNIFFLNYNIYVPFKFKNCSKTLKFYDFFKFYKKYKNNIYYLKKSTNYKKIKYFNNLFGLFLKYKNNYKKIIYKNKINNKNGLNLFKIINIINYSKTNTLIKNDSMLNDYHIFLKLFLNLNKLILKLNNIYLADLLILSVKFILKIIYYSYGSLFFNKRFVIKKFLRYLNYKKNKLPIFKIWNFLTNKNLGGLFKVFNKIISIKILLCIEVLKFKYRKNYSIGFFSYGFKNFFLIIKEKLLTSKILKSKKYIDKISYTMTIPYSVKTIMIKIKDNKKNKEILIKNKKANLNYLSVYKWVYILNKIISVLYKFIFITKHIKNISIKNKIKKKCLMINKFSLILKKLICIIQKIIKKPMFCLVLDKSKFLFLNKKKYKNKQNNLNIVKKNIKETKKKKYFYKNYYNNLGLGVVRKIKSKNTNWSKKKNLNIFLVNYLKLKVGEISEPGVRASAVRRNNLIENWYLSIQKPVFIKKYRKWMGKGWILNNSKTYLKLLNYNYSNTDICSFYSEYGLIWINSFVKVLQNKLNIYEDYSNFKIKKFDNLNNLIDIYQNIEFKDLIKLVSLKKNQRLWLIKKYKNFKHKKSIFLIIRNQKNINNILNYYFFKDYTEIIIKFLINRTVWSGIYFNFSDKLEKNLKYNNYVNIKKNNYLKTPLYYSFYNAKLLNFNTNGFIGDLFFKKLIKNTINSSEFFNQILLLTTTLDSSSLGRFYSNVNNINIRIGSNYNEIKEHKININKNFNIYWFQKFNSFKRSLGLPNAYNLREFWLKKILYYTTIPWKLIYYFDKLSILYISGVSKWILNSKNDINLPNIKKLYLYLNKNNKLDKSEIWYQEYFLKNKYSKFSGILGIKKNSGINSYFENNKNSLYGFGLYKIMYLRKVWKYLKFNLIAIKKFKKKLFKKYTFKNYFLLNFNNNFEIKKLSKIFYILHNKPIINNSNIKNNQEFLNSNKTLSINYEIRENIFILNPAISNFSISNYLFSKYYFSYFLVDKILSLLTLGYLNISFLNKYKNNVLYSKKQSSLTKIKDIVWVETIYSNINKIVSFNSFDNKIKKNLNFLNWRLYFFKNKNHKVLFLKKKNKLKYFFTLLLLMSKHLYNFGTSKILKKKFVKIPLVSIMFYFLNHFKTQNYLSISLKKKLKLPEILFIQNTSNSKLIKYYNQDQTKDYIINTLFYWGDNKLFKNNSKKNFYEWIDLIRINWKFQKILLIRFRSILKYMVKFPYQKILPMISSDFFYIVNKVQPITVEDCLYYRDYTNLIIHKVIVFIVLNKINLHVFRKKSITTIIDTLNLKYRNRLFWLEKFNISTLIGFGGRLVNYGGIHNKIKNLKIIKEKYNKPTIKKIKNKKLRYINNNINNKYVDKIKFDQKNINKILNISEQINRQLPERWQYSRRYDTWTDSSNTSLTSITHFEETEFHKNILLFKQAWHMLEIYSNQLSQQSDGFFNVNEQPDIFENFNNNFEHLENKKNKYINIDSKNIKFNNNFWNTNLDFSKLKDNKERNYINGNNSNSEEVLIFNDVEYYKEKEIDNVEDSYVKFVNNNEFFNSILLIKNKLNWENKKKIAIPTNFSNIYDQNILLSTNYNLNLWGFGNVWNLKNFDLNWQKNELGGIAGSLSGKSYDSRNFKKLFGWENVNYSDSFDIDISESSSSNTTTFFESSDYYNFNYNKKLHSGLNNKIKYTPELKKIYKNSKSTKDINEYFMDKSYKEYKKNLIDRLIHSETESEIKNMLGRGVWKSNLIKKKIKDNVLSNLLHKNIKNDKTYINNMRKPTKKLLSKQYKIINNNKYLKYNKISKKNKNKNYFNINKRKVGKYFNYSYLNLVKKTKNVGVAKVYNNENRLSTFKKNIILNILINDENNITYSNLILKQVDRKKEGIIVRNPDSWNIIKWERSLYPYKKNFKLYRIKNNVSSNNEITAYKNKIKRDLLRKINKYYGLINKNNQYIDKTHYYKIIKNLNKDWVYKLNQKNNKNNITYHFKNKIKYYKNIAKHIDLIDKKFKNNINLLNSKINNIYLLSYYNKNLKHKFLFSSSLDNGMDIKSKKFTEFYSGRIKLLKNKNYTDKNIYLNVGTARVGNFRNLTFKKNNFWKWYNIKKKNFKNKNSILKNNNYNNFDQNVGRGYINFENDFGAPEYIDQNEVPIWYDFLGSYVYFNENPWQINLYGDSGILNPQNSLLSNYNKLYDFNANQLFEVEDNIKFSNQKKNIYLKNHYNSGKLNKHITRDLFYKLVPSYIDGRWSGSDSGQTVLDYRRDSVIENNLEYKTYSPIFGFYILNTNRLNFDLSKFGREYFNNPFGFNHWKGKFLTFISDHDTKFFDDKSLHIHNIWLFWLEFYRHLYINRWRITLNYTKTTIKNFNSKYPIGFTHEIYWFKFLVFSRFIKNILKKINNKNLIINKKKHIKNCLFKNKINFLMYKSVINIFIYEIFYKKLKINKKYKYLQKNDIYKKLNINFEDKIKTSYLNNKNDKKKYIRIKSIFKKFPNYNITVPSWLSNYTIIFSKSIFQINNKKTNGIVSFLKPIRTYTSDNKFQEDEFILDSEIPIRNYIYYRNNIDDFEGDSIENNNNSETENNNEYISNYTKNYSRGTNKLINSNKKNDLKRNLNIHDAFLGLHHNIFGRQKKNYMRERYKTFRDVARKDSNLKYKRNWFFSNHILNDWVFTSTYTGNWLKFSDFEVDRQRPVSRNLKHGSKYRLNFNTELWWTRTEPLGIDFRRIDGIELDVENGALDSDGEIFHLHKGLLNVAFLEENNDYSETILPLFERSIIDPESPALNEDGDFPEFDLNIIYNTELIKRLNLSIDKSSEVVFNENKLKKTDISESELDFWEDNDNLLKNTINNSQNNLKKKNKSLSFKFGSVDWDSKTFYNKNINIEVENLTKSIVSRKINSNLEYLKNIKKNQVMGFNFNPLDFGSIIDAMSNKDIHPINYSTENFYIDLIDQKIDESLEYYAITGYSYSCLFLNYKNLNFLKENKNLDWFEIDFILETNFDSFENLPGFDYELILHKYAHNYWKLILEIDCSWSNTFTFAFPQIHDPINNIDEYLPVWNYDPSLWELYGFDYENTPLLVIDDSKLLLNSKTSRFDIQYNWLSQKDLTSPGISINNLSWGGSNIIKGLGEHIPYDYFYASDDDSDFELYGELFFFKNIEEKESMELMSSHLEYTKTSNTKSREYPKNGFNLQERRFKKFKTKISHRMSHNLSNVMTTFSPIGERQYHRLFNYKTKSSRLRKNINTKNIGLKNKSNIQKINKNEVYDLISRNSTKKNSNIFIKTEKINNSKSIDNYRNFEYIGPIGLFSKKDKIISNNFWKSVYLFFINKYSNKLKKKNNLQVLLKKKNYNILKINKNSLNKVTSVFNLNTYDWGNENYYLNEIIKSKNVGKLKYYLKNQNLNIFKRSIFKNNNIQLTKNKKIINLNIINSKIFINLIHNYLNSQNLKNKKINKLKHEISSIAKINKNKLIKIYIGKKKLIKEIKTWQKNINYKVNQLNIFSFFNNRIYFKLFIKKNKFFILNIIKNIKINKNLLNSLIINKIIKNKNNTILIKEYHFSLIYLKKIKKIIKTILKKNYIKSKKFNNYLFLKVLPIFLKFKKVRLLLFKNIYTTLNTKRLNFFYMPPYSLNNNKNLKKILKSEIKLTLNYTKNNFLKTIYKYINNNKKINIKKNYKMLSIDKSFINNILKKKCAVAVILIKMLNIKEIVTKMFIYNLFFKLEIKYSLNIKKKIKNYKIIYKENSLLLNKFLTISLQIFNIWNNKNNLKNSKYFENKINFLKVIIIKNYLQYSNHLVTKNIEYLHTPKLSKLSNILKILEIYCKFLMLNIYKLKNNIKIKKNMNISHLTYKYIISKENNLIKINKLVKNNVVFNKKSNYMSKPNFSIIFYNFLNFKKLKNTISTIVKKTLKIYQNFILYFKKLNHFLYIFKIKKYNLIKSLNFKFFYFKNTKHINKKKNYYKNKKNTLNIILNNKIKKKNYYKNKKNTLTINKNINIKKSKYVTKKWNLKDLLIIKTKKKYVIQDSLKIKPIDIIDNKTSLIIKKNTNKKNENWNWWEEFDSITFDLKNNNNYNYFNQNFQLGTKRGGVGDTSHWSSGTEYLNEQFKRSESAFNNSYKINDKVWRRNNKNLLNNDQISEHTNYYHEHQSYRDIDMYTEDPLRGYMTSQNSDIVRNLMSDNLNPIDMFYDNKSDQGVAFEQFSYIDWGFDTDQDNINSDLNFWQTDKFTGDMQRDASTESVYLDYLQFEYAREMREFPEEIGDWTVSDYYSEVFNKLEISEMPISTNESELYSIDSSNSISDYVLGVNTESDLKGRTLHISNEPSSEFADLIFLNNKRSGNRFYFDFFHKIESIQNYEANVTPNSHPELDIFTGPNYLINKNNSKFDDFFDKSVYESKKLEESGLRDWFDSNKMELEENTREPESFIKQQNYIDSFKIEAILDELLIQINVKKQNGLEFSINEYIKNGAFFEPLSLKWVIFTKTNYLLHYRGIMVDLGLEKYMF